MAQAKARKKSKSAVRAKPAAKKSAKAPAKKAAKKTTAWPQAFQKLIQKYGKEPHPLTYSSPYELLVKVVLSAQTNDAFINKITPEFLKAYPDFRSIARGTAEDLYPYLKGVRNFANKSKWLFAIASKLEESEQIPRTMETLTELPGIGRKSASVLLRELGGTGAGVIVDIHVLRVAPRLGISKQEDAGKMEKEIMAVLPESMWADAGMCISFLGRDVCRPTAPDCGNCVMQKVCEYAAKK